MGLGTIAAETGLELGGNILTGLFNSGISYGYSKRLMRYQSELNQQMIDRANEYNLPKNQVSRLIQGGLNPNLAYQGISGSSASTSGSVGLGSAGSPGVRFSMIDTLRNAQQLETDKATTDLTRAKAYEQLLLNKKLEEEEEFWRSNAAYRNDFYKWQTAEGEYKYKNEYINYRINSILEAAYEGEGDTEFGNMWGKPFSTFPYYQSIIADLKSKGMKNQQIQANINLLEEKVKEVRQHIQLMLSQGKLVDARAMMQGFENTMRQTMGVTSKDGLGWRILAIMMASAGLPLTKLLDVLSSFKDE